jgi:enhancing lycopene biosynthesis protein 2
MKKIGVLLSGCGVYDGSEIQETVLVLLALAEQGFEAFIFAPNIEQHHVINHITGEEMPENRNVLIESARIARGNITALDKVTAQDFDALLLPGGFGTAKNHTKWAFQGAEGDILPDVKRIIVEVIQAGKPIVGLCMAPTTIAKALEDTNLQTTLTVGTTQAASPYEIATIASGIEKVGAIHVPKTVQEIAIDFQNNIITAPCYMMEASLLEVRNNIKQAIEALAEMLK